MQVSLFLFQTAHVIFLLILTMNSSTWCGGWALSERLPSSTSTGQQVTLSLRQNNSSNSYAESLQICMYQSLYTTMADKYTFLRSSRYSTVFETSTIAPIRDILYYSANPLISVSFHTTNACFFLQLLTLPCFWAARLWITVCFLWSARTVNHSKLSRSWPWKMPRSPQGLVLQEWTAATWL